MARKNKKNKKKESARKQATKRNAEASADVAPSGDTAPVAVVHMPPAAAAEPAPLPSAPLAPAPPSDLDEPVVEDIDLDLDADADYASLVAQVAGLPDDTAPPAPGPARRPRPAKPVPTEDLVEVLDLDDDEGASEAIDRLLAQALGGAPREEATPEPEVAFIDLDLDADVTPAPPRARASRPAPAGGPPPSRLVQAAAAGGMDDVDEPGISLDLGEVSTPEARYRVPVADTRQAARWKALASGVLLVLAGAVAVAPPQWVRPEPPAQLNAAARTRDIRMALLLQAQQVEAFRVQSQQLPNSLDELLALLSGVRYARSGNRAYQLIAYESDGNAIVYDSANPAQPFRILMSAWAPGSAP
ncbi:MAG: hypothetical protein EXR91_10435 [Gemmatimonadetes bacterium]|nr:hypothetical protein [Gemmatimonadota bacterium]